MPNHGVCPWWAGYFLASPLRRLLQDPEALLAPHVRPGMTVLEPGPGMGFFTLALARLVGPTGRVVAVDVEPRMIAGLQRRAKRAGLLAQIDARAVPPESMALGEFAQAVDFVLAYAVIHEMPAAASFFVESVDAMKPGAGLLLAEPAGHVDDAEFEAELTTAREAGLFIEGRPLLRGCKAALLRKPSARNAPYA